MKCLEKDPADRPQSALETLPALESVTTSSGERPRTAELRPVASKRYVPRKALVPGIIAGAAIALVVAWQARRGSEPASSLSELRSIAVLPFANVDGDTANAYFADGIGEELATSLSKVPGLRVIARNSSFRTSGRQVDELEAAKVLDVDAILAGSVRRAGGQLRLNARLVGAKDQALLWSDQYDREVKDVFAVQDEITRAIVGAIQGHLASSTGGAALPDSPLKSGRGTSNLGAHDLYLRAQFHLRRRSVPAAVDYFRRAIDLDSTYARAYSGLSAALEMTPYFAGIPADSVREPAIAAAQRALSLDPSLAEPHTSLALAYQHAHQWKEAEAEHRRAVSVDPGDAAAHVQLARFLLLNGRAEEALAEARRAEALDPFSPVIASWVAHISLFMGKTDQALAAAKRGMELDSTTAPAIYAASLAYLVAGNNKAAIETIDRLPNVLPWPGFVALVHASAGDPETAKRIVREIESRPRAWSAQTTLAWAYLGLKDTTRALDALERATDYHEMWFVWYSLGYRLYDPIRGSARFAALVRRVGLDEKVINALQASPLR
jgi:serine/threonine-protein kinase